MEIYQVKSGDTLSSIAKDVLGDAARWPEIAKLNNVVDVNMIFPGAQLLMPAADKLEPITITTKRRGEVAPAADPAPRTAGLGFDLTPEMMAYLAAGALLIYLAMEDRR